MLAVFRALLLLLWVAALTIEKAVAAGGKLTAAATWTPEGVPTTTTDLQVTSTTTGNVENAALLTCRSLNFALAGVNYSHTWKWSAKLTVGGAAEGEGENKGVLLALSSGMTVTLSGASMLVKGAGGGSITSAGHELPPITVEGEGTYKLADTMNLGSSSMTVVKGTGELNGQRLECTALLMPSGSQTRGVVLGAGGYLKLTGTGTVLEQNATVNNTITFTGTGGTVEISNTSNTLKKTIGSAPQKSTIGTLLVTGENIALDNACETIALLQLNNSFNTASSGRFGLLLGTGTAFNITAITTSGKAGELAKLQGNEGKATIVIAGEVALDYVEYKNLKINKEAGVLATRFYGGSHSVDGGGNEGILFRDPPVSLTRTASDSATVSDAATRTQADARSVSDSATATEAATLLATYARSASDSATVSEASQRLAGGERATSDSATISDAATRESAATGTASDSMTVEDSPAITTSYVLTASESVNFAEAVSRTSQATRSGSDTITATDSATRGASDSRSANEELHITEDVSTAGKGTRSTSDEVQVSDAAARTMHDPRSGADALSLTDSPTSGAGHSRSTAETVTLTDSGERLLSLIRMASDTATIGEVATYIGSWVREPSDELTVSEAVTQGFAARASDSIALADAAQAVTTGTRTAADTIHQTDAATRISVTTIYPTAIRFKNYKQARIEIVNYKQARIVFVNRHKEIAR